MKQKKNTAMIQSKRSPLAAISVVVLGVSVLGVSVLALAEPGFAQQTPFSPAITINNDVVTYYEIEQRERFFELLNAPGDLAERARQTLLEERLQQQAGSLLGVSATIDEIEAGMEEFATRANLTTEELVLAIQQDGVDAETFRDFVAAGVTWRNVLSARFGPQSQVSDDEIDRALALGSGGGARVRLAELIVPLTPETEEDVRILMNDLSRNLQGDTGGFAQAAREYSAAPTAPDGGLLEWRPLSTIPEGLQSLVLVLGDGDVTEPVPLGPAMAIFQMRGFQETGFTSPTVSAVDYATIALPGGRSPETLANAQDVINDLDSCDDLYGVLPGGFERSALPIGEVPADISFELSKLDAGEISTALTRNEGQTLLMVMLCGRSTELPEGGREEIRQALFTQRLESYASGYLEELRAGAIIREAE